jgi:hypothetical protein
METAIARSATDAESQKTRGGGMSCKVSEAKLYHIRTMSFGTIEPIKSPLRCCGDRGRPQIINLMCGRLRCEEGQRCHSLAAQRFPITLFCRKGLT